MMALAAMLLTASPAQPGARLVSFGSAADFLGFSTDGVGWNESSRSVTAAGVSLAETGVLVSPAIPAPEGFDAAIVSWNADTPGASYLVFKLSARVGDQWTPEYTMGLWHSGGHDRPRTSVAGQDDDFARVDTDILILKRQARAVRVKVEFRGESVFAPSLRFLSICLSRSGDARTEDAVRGPAWGKELDVPQLCQLSVPDGRPWCSPTSVAMVLGYWADKLDRPELAVGITETARCVFDDAWGGTGNWTFNTAYAGQFAGMRAYVTRLQSASQLERLISSGFPVVLSLDYNKLNRRKTDKSMGHLVVVRGFTRGGNLIINDPWAHLDQGETVRKVFKRGDVEAAWLGSAGSQGTVYLIHPQNLRPHL